MAFTAFDLSTAEFPDSGFTGSYVDGMIVPDFAADGLIFWLPGMVRDLALFYTIVVDFEVTGDFPYTGRPHANAFQWRNDGDYASSSTSTIAVGDAGRKPIASLVIQVSPGGNPVEERVAFFNFANCPPVTGVRWQESTSIPTTGNTFGTAVPAVFGQVYEVAGDSMPADPTENTTLATPDAIGSAWFTFTLPQDGVLQGFDTSNGTIYSGTSLGSLTYVADISTVPELSAGSYYLRLWSQFGGFSSFPSLAGYRAASIYGDWITPNPSDNPFTLNLDGNTSSPLEDTTYLTQQEVDAGIDVGGVATWDYLRVDSPNASAPAFNSGDLGGVLSNAATLNPVTPEPPFGVSSAGWHILNASLIGGVGDNGWRDYGGSMTRVPWFLSLRIPFTPGLDSLATGWQNEDGSSDTPSIAVAQSGDLEATFQHSNTTADGGSFSSGSWTAYFAPVSGAALNIDGYVDNDIFSPPGSFLFSFGRDSDNLTEDQSASFDLTGEGEIFGFVEWYSTISGVTEDESGQVGTYLSDGTFTVTYQAPNFRPRFDGIEVLLPLAGDVSLVPPLLLTNRNDMFSSAPSLAIVNSRQGSNRLTGYL